MKTIIKKIITQKLLLVSSIFIVAILSSTFFYQQTPWNVPASANSKKNPLTSDASTIAAGKVVYDKECLSCHGKKGKGDGKSAADLDVPVGDMTSAKTQNQSDGALFWKISEGRKPMPTFKKKLTEDQIWQVLIYMRTLK